MVVGEGITSLLFPFAWPHVYVPILPASLHHFLDAPVPFLMGKPLSSNVFATSHLILCFAKWLFLLESLYTLLFFFFENYCDSYIYLFLGLNHFQFWTFLGLYASFENIKIASEASLCYVDIDKCKVQLPEELAAFPQLEAFTAEVWSVLDKHGVHPSNCEQSRNTQVYLLNWKHMIINFCAFDLLPNHFNLKNILVTFKAF